MTYQDAFFHETMPAVHVTVVFGKHSTSISLAPHEMQSLDALKQKIGETFKLDPKFQRLVLQGRDVQTASALTPGCKLLLLRNRAFYEKAAAVKQVEPSMDAVLASSQQLVDARSPRGSKTSEIDVNELEQDVVWVQVYRGKSRYDVILQRSKSVLDVKHKVSAVLGLRSPTALRLVVKGKTPSDETTLETLAGRKKVIKSMALLQVQQHVIQEKEQKLRELLNELVRVHTTFEKVRKHMARNFMSKDESLLELARVLDDAQRIADNLELVQRHLVGTNATNETLSAVTDAINEANTLSKTTRKLLERHALS
ncbi:hypothetical protein PsorP6_012178 [Peronosclerospora sorghi]|uniref:Uncharacterized protein n=1 Tax=Peronosclerospora sorghi TaxID=230839 RepID=A0ACC0WIM2_9STRA|nr:hypothetical protein PsorP6_012178 [Peronosclerospora sorghi]